MVPAMTVASAAQETTAEFGSNGGGIGCELALRVPVAEFVRGLVRMSREAT